MNTIYTAIFGPYEELKEPRVITSGWRYICITDQDFYSDVWNVIKIPKRAFPILAARRDKITNFPINNSIWIDGSFTINCNLNDFWDKNMIGDFTVFSHPLRNCVYEEAEACIRNNRGEHESIRGYIELLKQNNIQSHSGLIQSGILMRRDTRTVRKFCDEWYAQMKYCTRDQLSFELMRKKYPKIISEVKGFNYRKNNDFIFKTHYSRRNDL